MTYREKKDLINVLSATRYFISNQEEIQKRRLIRLQEETKRKNENLEVIKNFLKNVKIENLIAVRLTDHFPDKGIVKPASKGLFLKLSLRTAIKGVLHDLEVEYPRYTLHFSLNHAVSAHTGGDWSSRRFAIILPLKDFIDKVISISEADTWVLGNMKLPHSAEILMKKTTYNGLENIREELSDLRLEILSRKKEFMDKETIQALDELESFLNKIEDYCKKLNKIEEEEFKEKYGDDKDGL